MRARAEAGSSRSPFLRAVVTILSGTLFAQLLPMLVSPLLTRLYSPEEYGVYAKIMLVAYGVSVLASAKYELAIMLPEDELDAFNIAAFCVIAAAALSAVAAFLLVVMRLRNIGWMGIGPYAAAVPPLVFLMSAYQTFTYWMLRKQQFGRLSLARVLRAVLTAVANIGFGFLAFRGGLVISTLLGQALATVVVGTQLLRDPTTDLRDIRLATIIPLLKRHRRFPFFALPADLMSTGSAQLPVAFLEASTAGIFNFVQTVINTPLSVAGSAVLDAFKERATRDYRERGEFRAILVKVGLALTALAVPPMAVLAASGPTLFALVFGEAWRGGGHVARILAIMYVFKFIASPLSYSFFIVEKQRENLLLHIYIIVSTTLILAVGLRWLHKVDETLLVFALNYATFYLAYMARSYQFSRGSRPRMGLSAQGRHVATNRTESS